MSFLSAAGQWRHLETVYTNHRRKSEGKNYICIHLYIINSKSHHICLFTSTVNFIVKVICFLFLCFKLISWNAVFGVSNQKVKQLKQKRPNFNYTFKSLMGLALTSKHDLLLQNVVRIKINLSPGKRNKRFMNQRKSNTLSNSDMRACNKFVHACILWEFEQLGFDKKSFQLNRL